MKVLRPRSLCPAVCLALALSGCDPRGSAAPEKEPVATSEKADPARSPETIAAPETADPEKEVAAEEPESPQEESPQSAPPAPRELEISDLKPGSGPAAKKGDEVLVHYTASLLDGSRFADTRSGEPYRFQLGDDSVIRGLDRGVSEMKVGGLRKLTIPARMAYGQRGVKDAEGAYTIPPGATLVFEVELLERRGSP